MKTTKLYEHEIYTQISGHEMANVICPHCNQYFRLAHPRNKHQLDNTIYTCTSNGHMDTRDLSVWLDNKEFKVVNATPLENAAYRYKKEEIQNG